MHLIIIQLHKQSPPVFGQFSSVQIFSPIHIFHRNTALRYSHQCIRCFKFPSTSTITLHPILFGKSTFTSNCACQAEVASLQSRNCKSYWNLEVSTRVPRLESRYVSIYKLQPLYFVRSIFGRSLHCEGWKLCRAQFCEVLGKQKTFLTAKMAYYRR